MRISDGSSDVCSSDLHRSDVAVTRLADDRIVRKQLRLGVLRYGHAIVVARLVDRRGRTRRNEALTVKVGAVAGLVQSGGVAGDRLGDERRNANATVLVNRRRRSDEHPTEFQALLRTPYAVL